MRGLSGLRRKARLFLFGDGVDASPASVVDDVRDSGGIPASLVLCELLLESAFSCSMPKGREDAKIYLEGLFHGAFHI